MRFSTYEAARRVQVELNQGHGFARAYIYHYCHGGFTVIRTNEPKSAFYDHLAHDEAYLVEIELAVQGE